MISNQLSSFNATIHKKQVTFSDELTYLGLFPKKTVIWSWVCRVNKLIK